mmetsp:Transcript_9787/g.29436  ORF Transcript_9787/g.29436 Transcript_9787/m.29436 type:complete len:128 (-) Transcript_9787:960-1343(-)|eukprot:CAMPEP_0206140118 /NCGR_PEP_ID=MMETSP1473-20131121/8373_1 /ASSEMBLY_ACC=CAM_ASM_001109 /TAXON_ID=1461547 /ORGANISM="Stichococcus sp, Strain RCC1054" /LENGTH=127 /DNA_ID=CAMNT_0053534135 /DNA_START=247 /DNA_END=630 /DNA_ORIENTATION=+
MATPLGQRVASEVEAAVVSLEALVRSARIPDAADDATTPKGGGSGNAAAAAQRLLLATRSLSEVAAHLKRTSLLSDFDFQGAAVDQQVARYEARTAAAEAELAAVQAQIRALEMEAGVQTQNPVAPL